MVSVKCSLPDTVTRVPPPPAPLVNEVSSTAKLRTVWGRGVEVARAPLSSDPSPLPALTRPLETPAVALRLSLGSKGKAPLVYAHLPPAQLCPEAHLPVPSREHSASICSWLEIRVRRAVMGGQAPALRASGPSAEARAASRRVSVLFAVPVPSPPVERLACSCVYLPRVLLAQAL